MLLRLPNSSTKLPPPFLLRQAVLVYIPRITIYIGQRELVVEQLADEVEYGRVLSTGTGLRLSAQVKRDVDPERFDTLGVSRIE
jgi:hypothetical protein